CDDQDGAVRHHRRQGFRGAEGQGVAGSEDRHLDRIVAAGEIDAELLHQRHEHSAQRAAAAVFQGSDRAGAEKSQVTAAIRTRELSKDYLVGFWRPRPYRALDRLSIDVAPGDVFGFLGPNGAGKTTTLKLLMQLVFPTSGEAEILGRPVGDVAVRRRIGYLPENPYFYDHLTAEELLHYYGRLFNIPSAERRQRIPATLDRLGIGAE